MLKILNDILSKLPFNGLKTKIGTLTMLVGLLLSFLEQVLPVVDAVSKAVIPFLSPEAVVIITATTGAITTIIGILHKLVKVAK